MKIARALTLCGALSVACSSDPTPTLQLPYAPNQTALIGNPDNADELLVKTYSTPDADECIALDGNVCAKPQTECGDNGAADVLLNEQGAVVDVICYPTDGVSVEAFDVALTREAVGFGHMYHPLIVSQRFYQYCKKQKFKLWWYPVVIDLS